MGNRITYHGKEIFYKDVGEGNALVFLHGFTETCDIWDDFSRELSHSFRIIAIDLPGHGKTGTFGEIHTMELIARVVKEVLDHLYILECLMIGHSMGGYATLAFARLYPTVLKGMVLFHSQAAADSTEAKENRERMVRLVRADHSNFIHQFIPSLFTPENAARYAAQIAELSLQASRITPASIIAALEGMKQRRDQTDLLAEVDFPVYFIAGKKDIRIPASLVMQQAAIPSHSEVLLMGNVAHMGYIESRDVTLQAVRGFALRTFGLYS